jgi:Ca2+-binding RTX toxin-like protein
MAIFHGTDGPDRILRHSVSAGVVTDPPGVTGTLTGWGSTIYGYGGDDVLEAGDGDGDYAGEEVHGGDGADTLTGGGPYSFLYGDAGDDLLRAGPPTAWGDTHTYFIGGDGDDRMVGARYGYNQFEGGAGSDTMIGGALADFYYIDDPCDRIVETSRSHESRDTVVVSGDFYALGANLEILEFTASCRDRLGVGNAGDNTLRGNAGDDRLRGRCGDDLLEGAAGRDGLRGGPGADTLTGGADADRLFAGAGSDVFQFADARDSHATARDVIAADAGAAAFDGAGPAQGDLIDLSYVDTDLTDGPYGDSGPFVFGSTRKGGLTVVDVGTNSLVRGNIDDDAGFELEILIRDGAVKASAYSADDFILALA